MKRILTVSALAFAAPIFAQDSSEPVTPSSVVASASTEEWLSIAPEDLLMMELAPDARGNGRTVVIQLAPAPFSQPWVENIRILARAHWWDRTSVYRVQDNYVAQWGDVTEGKALPDEVRSPDHPFALMKGSAAYDTLSKGFLERARERMQAEMTNARADAAREARREAGEAINPIAVRMIVPPMVLLQTDPYTEGATFQTGWPISVSYTAISPVHCYGYIGVARGYAPDTGTGAELYTIIGQPQRHMDRNLAVVGRVIEGIEHLSSLPRGSGDLGFYTEDEAELRTPIVSVRLASEMDAPPSYQYLDTRSETFARYVDVRANRDDAFYKQPAGGVDVCSVHVPVRRMID